MASNTPLQNIDDDEFDWEAAVKAIDLACQKPTKPSTSFSLQNSNQFTPNNTIFSTNNKRPSGSKQSTLDKFVGVSKTENYYVRDQNQHKGQAAKTWIHPGPSPRMENHGSRDQNQHRVEVDERVSRIEIDAEAAKTWIYPVNYSPRDYQFSITKTALFSNTLAVLPTGLGKTLIAAVVIYNYFRWFPEGKIVFAAPTKPLVSQQILACHKIVGMPQEWTIDMTGKTSPSKRAGFWKTKRVFFLTPQVLERDIRAGRCLVEQLVCLVIDEAHRASGNYAYCVAVRELMAVPVQLRILALSATPGDKLEKVQEVIDNLQISTLEYRDASDHEVSPYVHDKQIELVVVPMGRDAVEAYDLLLKVTLPFVDKLSRIGVLSKKDSRTLSPKDLLISRDKFKQAPPENLHNMKYEDVAAYFCVLISLQHFRKLLSSQGIKQTLDSMEDTLKNGNVARFLSRDEDLLKAKYLMYQSLSRGVPNPKMSKLFEVLIGHFKTKDPQNSRVMIFSSFRGSVREIINAITNIGDIVKATEFIGQSSGKKLKGQSQKVQQAVLEKFRTGEYNVLVSTSIGEEGLDIFEVDLVICFDANVSELRMVQRMGRTGRDHKGRVVILACEGKELKGYKQKRENSKKIRKHMQNGGINSFSFHPSPRMIPHIFKPEVQLVELSIEQYVPQGKKVKSDTPMQTPLSKAKLTDADNDLIKKYFQPGIDNPWKPSLIAFPHFQAFPSRYHQVDHSLRTGMLIDTMQQLQGLSFSRNNKEMFVEDEATSGFCIGFEASEQRESSMKDFQISHDSPKKDILRKVPDSDVLLPMESSKNKGTKNKQNLRGKNHPVHSYLFGSDFVSVDALGRVLVVSVPLIPLVQISHSKCSSASSMGLINCLKKDSFQFRDSLEDSKENKDMVGDERIFQTPVSEENLSKVEEKKPPLMVVDESSSEYKDFELSPRLTSFIKSGVVPESPIDDTGIFEGKGTGEFMVPDMVSPMKLDNELLLKSPVPNEKAVNDCLANGVDIPASSINDELRTPIHSVSGSGPKRCISPFPIIEEMETPLASKDWRLNSGDKSESVEQRREFKRLRKYGDLDRRPPEGNEEIVGPKKLARSCIRISRIANKRGKGEKKLVKDARAFIDEEAEVSSDGIVSDDEEVEQDDNSYDDSFIDDRINPTAASTQAESSKVDMMAIYRRSLYTQSPTQRFVDVSPDVNESRSSDGTTNHCPQTPSIGLDSTSKSSNRTTNHGLQTPPIALESTGKNSASSKLIPERIFSEAAMSCTSNWPPQENKNSKIEGRKRKLSFYQPRSVPIHNLEQEFFLHSEKSVGTTLASASQDPIGKIEPDGNIFDDDEFFQNIDLDAVEEQAAKLLNYKSQLSMQDNVMISEQNPRNPPLFDSPSFDLGI